ncbi:oxidoreductase [Punctularia strigosozonata HHB-11173 SS5]|uniref:oxidoreductase n=1 Tax=Punctularia strigosozonata (strain HHB-11173) TaxID=741275 RepID=UPI0004417F90|nr:oxidoreductase [Punctularia strigosozonata HHB-11173 SS5]EIN12180.1 oxidoreductase [Punctularia strigosozonata HHB-11173 SS5]
MSTTSTEKAKHPTTEHEDAGGSAHPQRWSSYMLEIYAGMKPPAPLPTLDFGKMEQMAREKMKDQIGAYDPLTPVVESPKAGELTIPGPRGAEAYMYTFGSAGTSSTERANRKAFETWRIVPRMLRDATVRNIETTIFGVKHPSPLFIAPIGVQGMVHPDGELATARAAQALGVPFIMSSASTRSIENVAEANGSGHRWYQLYWPKSDDITLSILSRAKRAGYSALVITLDTMILGWRPHDLDKSFIPFMYGVGIQVGTSDPVFMARHDLPPVHETPSWPYDQPAIASAALAGDPAARRAMQLGKEWLGEANSGRFRSWDELKLVRDHWAGPIVLKGIQSVRDAEKAAEVGCDGIVVSNHGGRQVDGALPSLYALDRICRSEKIRAAKENGFTVLFDSGIRTGSDVIKAIALGAQGILLGRPFMYGLMLAGQAGVEQVVRNILADTEITLGLIGYSSIADIYDKREEIVEKLDGF